jgi:hypothetical protein
LGALGYVPIQMPVIALAWAAAAGQVSALATRRYAPYPDAHERSPRGPFREAVRTIILAIRGRRVARQQRRRAFPS